MRDPLPDETVAMAQALSNWPANGKPQDVATLQLLREFGLVEEQVQNKRCRECGTEQPDWHWWKITSAGRAFLAAAGWAL